MERVSDQPARWSQATIYPDMWADPDDDPRNSEGVSPDGELATLQDYLTNYRMTLRIWSGTVDSDDPSDEGPSYVYALTRPFGADRARVPAGRRRPG
jgi:hypothetical protein